MKEQPSEIPVIAVLSKGDVKKGMLEYTIEGPIIKLESGLHITSSNNDISFRIQDSESIQESIRKHFPTDSVLLNPAASTSPIKLIIWKMSS